MNELKKILDETLFLSEKVANVHWSSHLELIEIFEIFKKITDEESDKEEIIEKIKKLSNNFEIPEDACKTYTKLMQNFLELNNIICIKGQM
jgi:iron-sulfur cluster repair protein YtfE (RIC family)